MPIFYIKDGTGNFVPVPALQGKQGEKGDPGVYVGTEQPDDAQVWVKSDGEADPILLYEEQELTDEQKAQARANIRAAEEGVLPPATHDTLGGMMVGEGLTVNGDGRVSVEPEGEYELIGEVTIDTDDVSSFWINKWPDGSSIKLCKLLTLITMPPTTDRTGNITVHTAIYDENRTVRHFSYVMQYHQSVNCYAALEVSARNGRLFADSGVSLSYSHLANRTYEKSASSVGEFAAAYIRDYAINPYESTFLLGTKITVYGVRYND